MRRPTSVRQEKQESSECRYYSGIGQSRRGLGWRSPWLTGGTRRACTVSPHSERARSTPQPEPSRYAGYHGPPGCRQSGPRTFRILQAPTFDTSGYVLTANTWGVGVRTSRRGRSGPTRAVATLASTMQSPAAGTPRPPLTPVTPGGRRGSEDPRRPPHSSPILALACIRWWRYLPSPPGSSKPPLHRVHVESTHVRAARHARFWPVERCPGWPGGCSRCLPRRP